MIYRPHRGGLAESLRAEVTLEPTYESLARHLNISAEDIEVHFYYHDTLQGWSNTYIVMVCGSATGFTNEEPRCLIF
jgi:hypothetical protein